ncbi:uncharacterized protein LAESUDRAFT_739275 [Laetiporus sulphureus 93-53]|uniref:Uncharacterized protein n=1 Tax=Laetiporus sulphureus 93-53 TaxID=1314785 RepID=A0A165BKY3_9APHY|nr:uncharacterized protein LAESUDRAFT_739275 [Laetiporus sulphureus 93-53]KZT01243.1 hypothetical protein LAESUDRAFT_739275 [Laetiporus sulphureus 93-53]
MEENPTACWKAVQDGDLFYTRHQIYSIPGKLPDVSDLHSIMRDTTEVVALGSETSLFGKSQIQVFSSAGEPLLVFSVGQRKIVRFGWTGDESLVVLNEEGDDYQQLAVFILGARVHESDAVALTGSLTLLEVNDWEGGKLLTLVNSDMPLLHSWVVILPDRTISRHVEVLLSLDASIYNVDNLESIDQRVCRGRFTHVSPSPNGKSLALHTLAKLGTMNVPGADGHVRQVGSCGNDAVLVTWDSLALLVGPFGPMFAITETDGARIAGPDSCGSIQKVSRKHHGDHRPPASSLSVFRLESIAPSAILCNAWEDFTLWSPKADENIRNVRPELDVAVNECIDAAGREWESFCQRRLLNVRRQNLDWDFLNLYDPSDFVQMGQTLKVLNAVRFMKSPATLRVLDLPTSSYLSFKTDAVFMRWACAKIMRSKPTATDSGRDAESDGDDAVCRSLLKKFEKLGGGDVSYADIAKRAWGVRRAHLTTKLLDDEPRASDQVLLLLSILALGSFFQLFQLIEQGGPQLTPVIKVMLHDFYCSDDRHIESVVLRLEEAATMSQLIILYDPSSRISSNKAARKCFSEGKERGFQAKVSQQQLKKETDGKIAFFGSSINETIRSCLVNGVVKRTDKLKSELKVPDKRYVMACFLAPRRGFWYVKLQALTAEYSKFEALTHVAPCDARRRVDLYMAEKECKDRGDKGKLEQLRKSCLNAFIARELDQIAASRDEMTGIGYLQRQLNECHRVAV